MLHVQWIRWGPFWHAVDGRLACVPASLSYSANLMLSTSLPNFSGLIYDSGGSFAWVVKQWFLQMKKNIDNTVSCLLHKTDFSRGVGGVLWAWVSHSAGSVSPLRVFSPAYVITSSFSRHSIQYLNDWFAWLKIQYLIFFFHMYKNIQ